MSSPAWNKKNKRQNSSKKSNNSSKKAIRLGGDKTKRKWFFDTEKGTKFIPNILQD